MAARQKILFMYDRIEVAERDWLACGLLWMSLGALALGPFGSVARIARVLFAFTISVHVMEAIYAAFRARAAGLNPQAWFLRTLVLGLFGLLTIDTHLKKAPLGRSAR